MLRHQHLAIPLIALLFVACASLLEPPVRDFGQPIQTDRLEYEVQHTDHGLKVEIPFTYKNETGKTVYVVNCHKQVPPALEKETDGAWVRAWTPTILLCLSAPIVIWPGATYSDTLRVLAAHPTSNAHPKFEVDKVEGSYRLVWHGLVHHYDENRQGFGEPLALEGRISNAFLLKRR